MSYAGPMFKHMIRWVVTTAALPGLALVVGPAAHANSAQPSVSATNPAPPGAESGSGGAPASQDQAPAAETPAAPPGGEAGNPPDEPTKSDSPYQAIVVRNPFGLKTPPPAPPPQETPPPQVSPNALKLTGVTTLLGERRAMFVLAEPGKPQLSSDLVKEGERDSVIPNLEVLQIDERAGAVRVVYGGKELSLDFVKDRLAAPAGPAVAPGAPGAPGQPGQARPIPGIPGGGAVAGVPGAGAFQAGGGVQPGMAQPGAFQPGAFQAGAFQANPGTANLNANSVANPNNASGLRSLPTRPTRTGTSYGGTANVDPTGGSQPVLAPEQQVLLMRASEELARRQGVPFPPSPPIPGIDNAGGGQPEQ